MNMKHYIYKITNKTNDMEYIGVRSHPFPEKDDYMSSSILLKELIKQQGGSTFKKEILEYFDSREEADEREEELVCVEWVLNPNTYNQRTGGPSGVALASLRLDVYDKVDEIVELYEEGMSAEELGDMYNVSADLIRSRIIPNDKKRSQSEANRLSKLKYRSGNMRQDINEKADKIILEYKSGDGMWVLSKRYDCHYQVIQRLLKENSIERRLPSESQKSRRDLKQPRRKDLWSCIDEIKSLYLQGLSKVAIGKKFNTSDTQIRLMLQKEGVMSKQNKKS